MIFCSDSSWRTLHCWINVRTWAIFFSRHLANMSSMVPLWASTDSSFVPNLGPRVRSHAVRGRLFIVLMIAAHISPNVFSLRNFLSNIHVLFLAYIHRHSYLSYISFKQYLHPFIMRQSFRHFFNSSWQADCSRSFMSDAVTTGQYSTEHSKSDPN